MLNKLPSMERFVKDELKTCYNCDKENSLTNNYCPHCGKKTRKHLYCNRCHKPINEMAQLVWGYFDNEPEVEGETEHNPYIPDDYDKKLPIAVHCLGCLKYYHLDCYKIEGCGCGVCP